MLTTLWSSCANVLCRQYTRCRTWMQRLASCFWYLVQCGHHDADELEPSKLDAMDCPTFPVKKRLNCDPKTQDAKKLHYRDF